MGEGWMFSRRNFLKGAGVGAVLVAGGGVWHASSRGVFSTGKGPAYEPWEYWAVDDGKGPLALVRAAILAANPHNTQPWLFRLSESRIDLFADTTRNIGRSIRISGRCIPGSGARWKTCFLPPGPTVMPIT